MATHSSILSWRIPWIEEPGGLQPMGSQRIRLDRVTKQHEPSVCPDLCVPRCGSLSLDNIVAVNL